jgi:hypothetical protein
MSKKNALIIPKIGFDARDCDVKDQVFNSDHNSLKIWMSGSAVIHALEWDGSGSNERGSVDIAHNLGYTPFYLCYFKLKHATKIWMQNSLDTSMLTGNYIDGRAYSNDTYLHCGVWVNGDDLGEFDAIVYYKILIDKAFE